MSHTRDNCQACAEQEAQAWDTQMEEKAVWRTWKRQARKTWEAGMAMIAKEHIDSLAARKGQKGQGECERCPAIAG